MYNVLLARSYWFEGYALNLRLGAHTNKAKKLAERVIPFYHKALSYQKDMPFAWLELGLLHGMRFHHLDSLEHYAGLVKSQTPTWITLYSSIAYAYINIGKHDKRMLEQSLPMAKRWIDEGLTVDSNAILLLDALSYWYSVQKRHDEGIKVLDKIIEITPKAMFFHYKANALWAAGRLKETEVAFLKAIELDSTFLADQWGLMNFYSKRKKHEQAIEIILKAISMDSTINYLYSKLGNEYRLLGQYEKAIPFFKKTIRRDSNSLMAYMYLGFCLEALNRTKEAEQEFQNAIRLRPDYYRSYYVMARIRSMDNKLDEAFDYLRISLQKNDKQNKFNSYRHLQRTKVFENMRSQTSRWNDLLKDFFPDKF